LPFKCNLQRYTKELGHEDAETKRTYYEVKDPATGESTVGRLLHLTPWGGCQIGYMCDQNLTYGLHSLPGGGVRFGTCATRT
jgi:hypothetical protein